MRRGSTGASTAMTGGPAGGTKQIVFSVKAGAVVPAYLRELRSTIDREDAQPGVPLAFETPISGDAD